MSGLVRERVRTITSAKRRESTEPPGGMMLAMVEKICLVISKGLGASLRRNLPVARMKLSAMKVWRGLLSAPVQI